MSLHSLVNLLVFPLHLFIDGGGDVGLLGGAQLPVHLGPVAHILIVPRHLATLLRGEDSQRHLLQHIGLQILRGLETFLVTESPSMTHRHVIRSVKVIVKVFIRNVFQLWIIVARFPFLGRVDICGAPGGRFLAIKLRRTNKLTAILQTDGRCLEFGVRDFVRQILTIGAEI